MRFIICLPLLLILTLSSNSQQLSRQALVDYTVSITEGTKHPVSINSTQTGSKFSKAGIMAGDTIVAVNRVAITSVLAYQKAKARLRAGQRTEITIKRKKEIHKVICIPEAKPLEETEGIITTYDAVQTANGYNVRMIITKPKGVVQQLPVIFFIQWLSCDQVELNRSGMDGWGYLIEDLVKKTGFAVVRTEKPGLGDSEGPDCSECDLQNEINAYKASLKKTLQYDFIDKNNVFIVGGSIGGALAPIIAEGQNIKGIVSTGGFSTTWYEHILDFERGRLLLSGTKPEQLDKDIKQFALFYNSYLILKKKPSDILKSNSTYRSLWYQSDDLQFGRPAKYYQQLQDLNMSTYWSKITCPVLVVYGEYDWIMSRAEQENIISILSKRNKGKAELKIIPGMNHHYSVYSSAQEAFDEPFVKYEPAAFEIINQWLKNIASGR